MHKTATTLNRATYFWETCFFFCPPFVCLFVLCFVCLQAGKWEEREYRLDELEKHKRVALTRTLPSLDNPLHSGKRNHACT